MLNLDKKDFQILFELDSDARQSISDLARKTTLSRDVVSYRIKQLEEKGVIKGYYTVIDSSAFVSSIVRLYLHVQNTTLEIEEKMAAFLLAQNSNFTVYLIDGRYQLAAGFLVSDLREYQKMYEGFLTRFRSYVAESNVSFFVEYVHYPRNYLVEKKLHRFTPVVIGRAPFYVIDTKDEELLHLIKENARITLLQLAVHMGITPTAVNYRLRQLEKQGVIVGYKVLLDIGKLGYEYYKVDLMLDDLSIISALSEYILRCPYVTYRDITVGGSDFEFDCEFKSQRDFYLFIDGLRSLFLGKIRSYHYYKARKIYRYSYFPDYLLGGKKLGEKKLLGQKKLLGKKKSARSDTRDSHVTKRKDSKS